MTTHLKQITDANFDQELGSSSQVALLDFFATWCGPCKQIAPLIDEIAEDYAGRVVVAKIDIDQNPRLKDRFGIRGVPTLLLLKDGSELSRSHSMTKSRLAAALDALLDEAGGS
jgi:thioredoxin 1